MLFSKKSSGFFVEFTESTVLLARTSSLDAPLAIEDLRECPAGNAEALATAIREMYPRKPPGGYMRAAVGIYPARRVVRRHSMELKRMREPTYLTEVFTQTLRIEQDKFTIAVINSADGSDYDLAKAAQKEVLFCGLPDEDLITAQDSILASGIFPERLELGSVSILGGVVDWLDFSKVKTPVLLLEVGAESTHSFIVTSAGVEASRPIPQGITAMIPIIQKELGLKDDEAARKLFRSNTFDFAGMGPLLVKRLLKELQSSIGFYEVQTGQSVTQVLCLQLADRLSWLESTVAASLGISALPFDPAPWLKARGVTVPDALAKTVSDPRWFGLLSLMVHYKPAHAAPPAQEKK